jgi:hypothetical protein
MAKTIVRTRKNSKSPDADDRITITLNELGVAFEPSDDFATRRKKQGQFVELMLASITAFVRFARYKAAQLDPDDYASREKFWGYIQHSDQLAESLPGNEVSCNLIALESVIQFLNSFTE